MMKFQGGWSLLIALGATARLSFANQRLYLIETSHGPNLKFTRPCPRWEYLESSRLEHGLELGGA